MLKVLWSSTRVRLLVVVLAAGSAAFTGARSSQAWPCVMECDDSTWFRALQDCVWGPPATCTSCIVVCPRVV